jgi:hypothetical protein
VKSNKLCYQIRNPLITLTLPSKRATIIWVDSRTPSPGGDPKRHDSSQGDSLFIDYDLIPAIIRVRFNIHLFIRLLFNVSTLE